MEKNIFTKEKVLPFILTAIVIILDQVTKALVVANIPVGTYGNPDSFFNLVYVKNTGVAFSMGDSFPDTLRKLLFILVPLVVIILVIVVYFRNKDFTRLQRWTICGIIGGGLGNLIDRAFRPDGVIDFLDFKFYGIFGLNRWPTFNVADSAVVVCGILLFVSFIIYVAKDHMAKSEKKSKKNSKNDSKDKSEKNDLNGGSNE